MRKSILSVFILVTSLSLSASTPSRYIFRCILDEGVGELYTFTGYKYEKTASYPIYCGDLSGPKCRKDDFKSPWGKYSLKNLIFYNGYPACYVSYPNQYDKSRGATGSGIMVHGGKSSVGCISVQNAEFLSTKLSKLVENGEVHIFPSRMTNEKVSLWKKLLPNETDLIDQLQSLYGSINDCKPEEKGIFSVKIELVNDQEVFGFEKKQYDFVAGSIEGVGDYLKSFIVKDSVIWDYVGDNTSGYTRFSLQQTGYLSRWVPFKKIEIFLDGELFATFSKTINGFTLNANMGIPEGLLLVRETDSMHEKRSVFDNPVVVYAGGIRYVTNQNDLPFKFSSSLKYPQGVIVPELKGDISIVSVSGQTKISRAAGETGLFVKN